MRTIVSRIAWFILAGTLSTSLALAADRPIGSLSADGKVSLESPTSSFSVENQDYAYFSGDLISTATGATAVVHLNDGLEILFVGDSTGRITRSDAGYRIELDTGHMLVDAEAGTDYSILHDGTPVPRDQTLAADGQPFIASVASDGAVQFYRPAQLDDDPDRSGALWGLSGGQIAALLAFVGGTTYLITKDDEGPSS